MLSTVQFTCFTALEYFSVLLYLRIIYVLLMRPGFRSHFYYFLIIFGISNLLNYFVVFLFYILPMFGPTAEFYGQLPAGYWIGPTGFLVYYTAYQQDFLHVSIAWNRLTAVWWPFSQNNHWSKWWRWHVIFALLMPLPFTLHTLISYGKYAPLFDGNSTAGYIPIEFKFPFYDMDPTMVTIVINGICLIACLICNAATFAKIGCIKRTIEGTNTNSGANQVELNLIIITVMLSAILSTSLIFQLIFFLLKDGNLLFNILDGNVNNAFYQVYSQLPWVNDLRALSQPWLLLVVSQKIRNEATFGILSRKKQNKVIVVTPAGQNNFTMLQQSSSMMRTY